MTMSGWFIGTSTPGVSSDRSPTSLATLAMKS
jgi:hypothetical protein